MPEDRQPDSAAQANPKAVVGALAVLGIAALILGFFHIVNSIRSPFITNRTNSNSSLAAITEADRKLQQQDTDQDGISDYDELYQSETSPFLKDSDSDGTDDKAELSLGTDPNCPTGKTCGLVLTPSTNGDINSGASNSNSSVADTTDAATIRQTLKDAGAPVYILDSTDDATLLQMYREVTGAAGTANSNGSETNTSSTDETDVLTSLRDLSPTEIRDLLVQGGVDRTTLDQMDDTALRQLFQQAIDEELTTTP